jgi:CubicO group peptidase (beta-lactamase class C family)
MRLVSRLIVLLAALSGTGAAQQPLPDSTRIALNRVFANWTHTDGPGCAVAVSRRGQTIFENGYGMANLETSTPITPASVFHVASVSKQFTAAAVTLLARDGKLSLDDDIRKHLPEIPDYGHRITIRHLLTHTSGLRDQWDLLFMARGRFDEDRITEEDVLEIVSRQKALNFIPGAEYLYSNTGFTLAGTIVRRVSGKSLREFADERIFKPLGMTSTHFHDDYTMVVKGRAAGYARGSDGKWHVSLPNYDTYGATSLFTTVGDLLRWQANFDKPVVGDGALLREMQASATVANGDTTGYGLGLSTDEYRGARFTGHGGADAGYRTVLGRFPAHGLSVAVLCNAAQANPTALLRGVADVLIGGSLAVVDAPPRATTTLTAEQLGRYAGVYVNSASGAITFVTLRRDSLVLGRVNGPLLLPVSETRFRVTGQPFAELEFTPDGNLIQRVSNVWPLRQPVTLKRERLAVATRAQLDQYAGTYHSEELGSSYTVTATDSTLQLKTRMGSARSVRPAYGDTFVGDFLITFTRTRGGKVDGMLMSSGRVRRVAFVKSEVRGPRSE